MSLYTRLVQADIPLDSHESDLYAKVTPESTALIQAYEFRCNVRRFRSQIDGTDWYDIPFAYLPWWERRNA